MSGRAFAIKAAIGDGGPAISLARHKTMYGGKLIAPGDAAFLFESRTGLIGRGLVTAAAAVPLDPALARQTPRVSVTVAGIVRGCVPLGRFDLEPFAGGDGPQAELWFKFYRQATDKIVGVSPAAAAFLDGFFPA